MAGEPIVDVVEDVPQQSIVEDMEIGEESIVDDTVFPGAEMEVSIFCWGRGGLLYNRP